jgi:hypothetical protein
MALFNPEKLARLLLYLWCVNNKKKHAITAAQKEQQIRIRRESRTGRFSYDREAS